MALGDILCDLYSLLQIQRKARIKPGRSDIQVYMLIQGSELAELKRHTWEMAEAFGLDSRIERYQGKRPIGLYSWYMECLLDIMKIDLDDPKQYPSPDSDGYQALKRLYLRMKDEYQGRFD
jgi:hypothetical protein